MDSRCRYRCLTLALLAFGVLFPASGEAQSAKERKTRNAVLFPHVASGGLSRAWHAQTLLFLSNGRQRANAGTIEFFDNDGKPWPVLLGEGAELSAKTTWMIPPEETKLLVVADPSETIQIGWVEIRSFEKSAIQLIAVLQLFNGRDLVKESLVVIEPQGAAFQPYYMTSLQDQLLPEKAWPPEAASWISRVSMLSQASGKPGNSGNGFDGRKPAAARGLKQIGFASWYGGRFHGRRAASGEVFDRTRLTAAHRTLPFGTRVRITNLKNGQSVRVRVTDRGPYKKSRIVDLSKAAADQLGFTASGIAPVRLEVI